MQNKTTIKVGQETKAKLDKIGKRGETYEDIVLRLINEKGGSKWNK